MEAPSIIPAAAVVTNSRAVVVWEWCNSRGDWRPYSSAVVQLLERAMAKGLRTVYLGDAEPLLANVSVSLGRMEQLCDTADCVISVCRRLYSVDSAPARGALWQWSSVCSAGGGMERAGRGEWHCHDMPVQCVLERAWQSGANTVDLSTAFSHTFPYIVNFCNMTQVECVTGVVQSVRRQRVASYPLVKITPTDSVYTPLSPEQLERLGSAKPHTRKQKRSQSQKKAGSAGEIRGGTKSRLLQRLSRLSIKISESKSAPAPEPTAPTSPVSGTAPTVTSRGRRDSESSLWSSVSTRRRPMDSRRLSVATVSTYVSHGSEQSVLLMCADEPQAGAEEVLQQLLSTYTTSVDPSVWPTAACPLCRSQLVPDRASDSSVSSAVPDSVGSVLQLNRCCHLVHQECLCQHTFQKSFIECLCCGMVYGEKHGNQPPGRMTTRLLPIPLPGYLENTIEISYTISPGIQGRHHPDPGHPLIVEGFPRICYLPDTADGNQVLCLLREAWRRRLIFSVSDGSSSDHTPGTVVWNNIEHVTELHADRSTGSECADRKCLARITAQLAMLGVT